MKFFASLSSRILTLLWIVGGVFVLLAVGGGCHRALPESTSATAIPNPFLLEITGSNKSWVATYPPVTQDQRAGKVVAAAQGIHLPLGTEIILVLHSTDYVYTFAIPQKGLKEIAVPGLEFRMAIHPGKDRQLELVGEGLCGDPHTEVPANLIFEPPEQFLQWQRNQREPPIVNTPDTAYPQSRS
ncbi:MAG: hypothetical protein ACKVP0_18410 [Pirellulaceae bacterium]